MSDQKWKRRIIRIVEKKKKDAMEDSNEYECAIKDLIFFLQGNRYNETARGRSLHIRVHYRRGKAALATIMQCLV